jgi:hypothetical protein
VIDSQRSFWDGGYVSEGGHLVREPRPNVAAEAGALNWGERSFTEHGRLPATPLPTPAAPVIPESAAATVVLPPLPQLGEPVSQSRPLDFILPDPNLISWRKAIRRPESE